MGYKNCDLNAMFEDWWYGELKLVLVSYENKYFEIFVLTMFWIIPDLWEIDEKIMYLNIQMSEKGCVEMVLNLPFSLYLRTSRSECEKWVYLNIFDLFRICEIIILNHGI